MEAEGFFFLICVFGVFTLLYYTTKRNINMGHRVLLIIIGLLCWFDEQTEGGPWVFTADLKKSSINLEVEIDLGLVKESDSEFSRMVLLQTFKK